MLPVRAAAFSSAGERFRDYLLRLPIQRALATFGLYSPLTRLYSPDDPLRFLIDGSRAVP